MIHVGIVKAIFIEITDNTLNKLSRFQDFLYRNFYNYESYKDMKPDSTLISSFLWNNQNH